MSERVVLAALFAACQGAALGRLLVAAAILSPDGLVVLRLAIVFQTYSLYLMLGVPEMLYLWRPRWQGDRGAEAASELSGFAMLVALAAATIGGLGAAVVLAQVYDAPAAVALAAAALTAAACVQIGFMSPSYLAHGDLVGRATRELAAAAAGLLGVWILGRQWGLAGVIVGLAGGYWLAAAVSRRAWRGVRPRISWALAREVVPPGIGQVSIQVGLMLLASLDIVLVSRWRHGDPELPLYVLAVALLTAVSGAAQAIAGPAIVRIIRQDDQETRSAHAVGHAVVGEAAQVSFLLALAAASAVMGIALLLPHYTGMHRWLPAVAVTCLASRMAYFPTLHLIVTEHRRVVLRAAGAGLVVLLALLYGLGQLWSAPTAMVLWSGALATCGYASLLLVKVLGRSSGPVLSVLAGFLVLMLTGSYATFSGWLDTPASVASIVLTCLVAAATFLRLRGPLPWERVFVWMPGSPFEHALRSSSK